MVQLQVTRNTGGETVLTEGALDSLQAKLRGAILLPGDAAYDDARTIWNALIDHRPTLIVRCTGAADPDARGRMLMFGSGGGLIYVDGTHSLSAARL